jgi:outer membrane lipoprotein
MTAIRAGGILFIFLILFVLGCATGISRQSHSRITFHGSFKDLQCSPGKHIGEIVLLGGKIIETTASPTFSGIKVLHLNLDRRERPLDNGRSEGRYLLQSNQFLDPEIYKEGALLTVLARLTGAEIRAIDGFNYEYPKGEILEIKIWPIYGRTAPDIHFGIGIGTWF